MAYLYIDFTENLNEGLGDKKWGRSDYFTQSLVDQYETVKRKLVGNLPSELSEFGSYIFPAINKRYFISLPALERKMEENKRGNKILRNVVIRPEADMFTKSVLPDTYDIIIIGDITFASITEITVKGIDIIDRGTVKYGEKSVICTAACAFNKKTVPNKNTGAVSSVPDYGRIDLHDSILTNDFVVELVEKCFPIPAPQKAIKTFEKWQKYINFRRYYLDKQTERCEEITEFNVCDAYMVTKEVYRRNEEEFEGLLLDGVKDFGRGEQIILSKEVAGSDGFPLICVIIEKNRKKVLSETMGKGGKGKPKYEVWLNRYTRDAMGLSCNLPRADEKRSKSYLLGERYLFSHVDIEPDLTGLENAFERELDKEYSAVISKYHGIILTQLRRYMEGVSPKIKAEYDKQLFDYTKGLDDKLNSDIQNNSDNEIKRAYQSEIDRRVAPLNAERKKKLEAIRAEADKIKKSKDSSDEKDEKLKELQGKSQVIDSEYDGKVEEAKKQVSLRQYYVNRNNMLVEKKSKSLTIQCQEAIGEAEKEKKKQLEQEYSNSIDSEKHAIKERLQQKLNEDKVERVENLTIRRYLIYFRPEDITSKITDIRKQIAFIEPKYLTYDNRAEKAKIDRQERALASILGGYVKNPFLPTYLFSPGTLAQSVGEDVKDPEWCLESLNDRQKLAVKRALRSESIFLLQGPPGTGKTQVIAEITAQLTKRGKKVLISSETHKAIDNVFDRLPKIPEIRPLRLIPSQNGKETNYSPERLVDNFYLNICGNLEKQVSRFENFEETKTEFDSTMKSLRFDYDRLLKLQIENKQVEQERSGLLTEIGRLNEEIEALRGKLLTAKEDSERLKRTLKYVESYCFSGEGVDERILQQYSQKVASLLMRFVCFENVTLDRVAELAKADIRIIREELDHLLGEDKLVELKGKQRQLRSVLSELMDSDTYEPPQEGDANFVEYKKYQSELIALNKEIKKCESASDFNIADSVIYSLVPDITGAKGILRELPSDLTQFNAELGDVVSIQRKQLVAKIDEYIGVENDIENSMNELKIQISDKKRMYEELGENAGIEEYGELSSQLKQKITRFFHDFGIVKEYDSDNLETAFDIIKDEWKILENEYNSSSAENRVKIPMYKEIVKYLSQEDILEEDRAAYTRELYNSANVFGITCTSRDKFTSAQLTELGKYGIESVDIRTQGIDVVIIDEVSKSSFLDLLIPILYGKTIILVGDHRQLPPMYDLRHMKDEDFEGLDEDVITKKINEDYTKLYEECFFKTLYESVPSDFRVMLNKQYRCHSHIMEVFNHFYGGKGKGLVIGKKQQDDEKVHNLTVRINGNTIIEPNKHIYFVDCDQKESSAFEGSTSKINEQEAQVAITLLKELDRSAKELVSQRKLRVDASKKIDERPSVGIICTYGDQAGLIKKKRKYQQFSGFSGKPDERLIISTVDDFQGDERDVIIVSMVRNPNSKRFDAEFIKKFERINVALSRARKLLIIVGSKKFLTEAGIIDLPDLEGDKSLDKTNFPVYREIIDTINFRGRILTARDIIGE